MPAPAWSIDDLAAAHGAPDVIFMDVEGFEAEALAGAGQTLAAGPDWFVEVHGDEMLSRYGATVPDVVGCFDPARYVLLGARDGVVRLRSGELASRKAAPPSRGLEHPSALERGRFPPLRPRAPEPTERRGRFGSHIPQPPPRHQGVRTARDPSGAHALLFV
ncbi:MAG: hypothetical protein M3481_09475 [Actinomycetota bacterium]|nr:hypothetical protein [Actinomycetota bacterium]